MAEKTDKKEEAKPAEAEAPKKAGGGGAIEIVSQPGQGTTVSVQFPAIDPSGSEIDALNKPSLI